jgi:DNA-binding response OmpR family regulator
VDVACNAVKALRLAQGGNFDLITLDIALPGGTGFEIFRRLKQLPGWHDTPVIFVSGRHAEEDRQRAFELGAVDYISKPFEPTDFIFRIKSHARPKTDSVSNLASEVSAT